MKQHRRTAGLNKEDIMEQYKQEFIDFMVESDVLKFGDFTLKSGRKSPFFMNAGAYVTGTLNLHIKICSSKSYVCFSWLSGSRKSLKPTNHCQAHNLVGSCLLPQHTFNLYMSVLLLQEYQHSPSLSASLTNVIKSAKHIEHMFVLCYNIYRYFRYHYFSIW